MRPARGRRAIGLGLLVPGLFLSHPGPADADAPAVSSSVRRAAHRPDSPADRTVRKGPGPKQHQQPVGQTVHVVRAGDSISRIASRYGVARKVLVDANKLAHPEQLRIGQRLVVPGAQLSRGGRPGRLIDVVLEHGDLLLVRAGPRRVPTRMYMASPEVDGQALGFAWPIEGRVISPF